MPGGREAEVDRMVVRLIGDASSYQKMMTQAQGITRQATKAIDNQIVQVTKRIMASGRALTTAITIPLVGFGTAGVKAFSDFDKAMTESTAIMKTTGDQVERMKSLTLSLSQEAIQSPKELAEAYFFLASAGKDAEQSMALLPGLAKFAAAGAFDMALATDLLTDAQSALGLSVKDATQDMRNMTRLSDVLVKANVLANASVKQFSESLTNDAGAAMKSFNIDLEEGVAVLAAMADQGNKGVAAGSEFARMIRLMGNAAIENTEAFDKWKITVFDGAGNLRNMADIIGDMEKSFKDLRTEQKLTALEELGFTALTARAILPVIGTSNAIRRYEAELRKAGGTTEEVADKQMKSFANQMKLLRNQVTVTAIEIGEGLAPMVRKLGEFVAGLAVKWRGLTPDQKAMVIQVGLIVAAIGPLILALKGVIAVVASLKLLIAGGIFGAMALGIGVVIEKTIGFKKVADIIEKSIKGWSIAIAKAKEGWSEFARDIRNTDEFGSGREGMIAREKARRDAEASGTMGIIPSILRSVEPFVTPKVPEEMGGPAKPESAFIRDVARDIEVQKKMKDAIKARDKAEKDAIKTQRDRAKALKEAIQMMRDEAALFGKSAKEIALYRAEQMGASADEKRIIAELQDQIAAKEKAKEATDKAREAEKRFRDSFKFGGIEGVGRGVEALSRLEEARNMRASAAEKPYDLKQVAKSIGPAKIQAMQKEWGNEFVKDYLKLIAENTQKTADKETITLKPAGLGKSGS